VLRVGDTAPDFELPDQDGEPIKLSSLRGQPVVLYFYPKADTPGCTTQACGVRDHMAEYERQGLNFRLLADEDHSVAETYGVWGEKKMYGKTFMGVQRATFIIDPEGKVAHVIPKVSPKTHDDEVLAALRDAA
jgi:thioredoxin-dependent peroxiredoxin